MTAHWRKYIRPLMWRCKWIELQIKKLQSRALKYDREIAEYDEKKESEFGGVMSEDFDSKSLPFSCQMRRNKVMKRKKRKRVEESTDVASYMSHHTLFSFYGINYKSSASCSIYFPAKCLICVFTFSVLFRKSEVCCWWY